MLRVGAEDATRAQVRRHHFAVIAAADDARAIARRRQDGAATHVHPPHLAVRLGKQQRFFAEYEDGGTAEKMDPTIAPRAATARVRSTTEAVRCGYRSYQAMQLSNPSAIFFPGILRPMKTMRLSRFSSLFQGR